MKTYIWKYVGGYEGEEQCIVAVKAQSLQEAQQQALVELRHNRQNYADDTMAEHILDGVKPFLVLAASENVGHASYYS